MTYREHIEYSFSESQKQGYVNRDIQDRLKAKRIKAILQFQLDR